MTCVPIAGEKSTKSRWKIAGERDDTGKEQKPKGDKKVGCGKLGRRTLYVRSTLLWNFMAYTENSRPLAWQPPAMPSQALKLVHLRVAELHSRRHGSTSAAHIAAARPCFPAAPRASSAGSVVLSNTMNSHRAAFRILARIGASQCRGFSRITPFSGHTPPTATIPMPYITEVTVRLQPARSCRCPWY